LKPFYKKHTTYTTTRDHTGSDFCSTPDIQFINGTMFIFNERKKFFLHFVTLKINFFKTILVLLNKKINISDINQNICSLVCLFLLAVILKNIFNISQDATEIGSFLKSLLNEIY